jgi:hypothetical protein
MIFSLAHTQQTIGCDFFYAVQESKKKIIANQFKTLK